MQIVAYLVDANVVLSTTIHMPNAILQVKVAVCTTIRTKLLRNGLCSAQMLYIMQQRRV
jgi:hypothetical protein